MLPFIHDAQSEEQLLKCYPVMHQLRPHFTEKAFLEQVKRQMKEGYHLVYLADTEVKACAGFRFLEFLAFGKILYVDDLITCASARCLGHGERILQWLIDFAQEKQCDQLHLDTGLQRHEAHKLYAKLHLKMVAHHYVLDLRALNRTCKDIGDVR